MSAIMSSGALKMPADRRNRARLAPQPCHLAGKGHEVQHHRHPALDERQIVRFGDRFPDLPDRLGHAWQPDVVEEPGGVRDQLVVLVGPHERVVFRRFQVLKAHIGRHIDPRDPVVGQVNALCQAGPHVDHVGHDGVPIEVRGAPAGGLEGLGEVMRQCLAGVSRVSAGKLRHKRANRNHVRLFVAHRRDVATEPLLVQRFHVRRPGRRLFCCGHQFFLPENTDPNAYSDVILSFGAGMQPSRCHFSPLECWLGRTFAMPSGPAGRRAAPWRVAPTVG